MMKILMLVGASGNNLKNYEDDENVDKMKVMMLAFSLVCADY